MSTFSLSFSGSIPDNYDQFIFPLNIKPFAKAMAEKIVQLAPKTVLETAAGTGACTVHLLSLLPDLIQYTATDINPAMLKKAQQKLTIYPQVNCDLVDACQLPYSDEQYDVQLSMFGLMFYEDKVKALSEAYRVLKNGGMMFTAVWDAMHYNTLHSAFYGHLEKCGNNTHRAFQDVPHNCSSLDNLKIMLETAGFSDFSIHIVRRPIGPVSTLDACKGYILGTPLHNEFISLDINPVDVVNTVSEALTMEHGEILAGFYRQAIFVEARK